MNMKIEYSYSNFIWFKTYFLRNTSILLKLLNLHVMAVQASIFHNKTLKIENNFLILKFSY